MILDKFQIQTETVVQHASKTKSGCKIFKRNLDILRNIQFKPFLVFIFFLQKTYSYRTDTLTSTLQNIETPEQAGRLKYTYLHV